MAPLPELEISLSHVSPGVYSATLRLSHVAGVKQQPHRGIEVKLDLDALRVARSEDMRDYGQLLGEQLFEHEDMRMVFLQARAQARAMGQPLRVCLALDHDSPELHALHWETLRDPREGTALFLDEQLPFSRYPRSMDGQPFRESAKGELRALVVIANPSDLGDRRPGGRVLTPVDVDGELKRVRASLKDIQIEVLASGGKATLEGLLSRLREGYDILYLVCHGARVKGAPWLWLESAEGGTALVEGTELIQRVKQLRTRPRLVVLASCQSAGAGGSQAQEAEVLAALGPGLAEVGVPAILAMQGNISMETVARFMPTFFAELGREGQIDRAMTAARGAVRDQPDWWMPVLFMRLESGSLWYVLGFGPSEGFKRWQGLLSQLRNRRCTPLLGPGLVEHLFGTSRDIARTLAEEHFFPLAPHEGEDLAQVNQYLAIAQGMRQFPRDELSRYIQRELKRRYGDRLLDATQLQQGRTVADLALEPSPGRLLTRAGELARADTPEEPHTILARLDCPLYITTNFDSLLKEALEAQGKKPELEFCRWKGDLESIQEHPLLKERAPDYKPSPDKPLVFHLFGTYEVPESLVITQDDYLDFLIGYTRNRELIPGSVLVALSSSSLLFIGFQVESLGFRTLLRSIISQEGGSRLSQLAHVAAQVDPREGRILDPDRAREYLESYFEHDVRIGVFWGGTRDFLEALSHRWRAGK